MIPRKEFEKLNVWEKTDVVKGDEVMTAFKRRARLQQARWRESQKRPMGPFRGKDRGAFMPVDAARDGGWNFLSPRVHMAADCRVAQKIPGQQLEADRLYANLLGSMPMCFNLFGELWGRPKEATKAVERWFEFEGRVESLNFEWSPGRDDRHYLANRSAFDAAFLLRLADGQRGIIGIETKYHEHAKVEDTPKKEKLNHYVRLTEESKRFRAGWQSAVVGTELQQIWLDHLLLLSMLRHKNEWGWGRYLLVFPAGNVSFKCASENYRECLIADDETFAVKTTEDLLDTGFLRPDPNMEMAFRERYLW
jgi:hypothetical protein